MDPSDPDFEQRDGIAGRDAAHARGYNVVKDVSRRLEDNAVSQTCFRQKDSGGVKHQKKPEGGGRAPATI